ncbi:MAG: DUF167 domain-containing protein [Candidatus Pacebacteria bacterium]|nr:DUF167 domain-containing protein [Candidatus Paceibacterota bacterium]
MYIHIKVKTGARREEFKKISEDHFSVSVREKPERNMANKKICELVAEHFKNTLSKIKMISGHHSPSKILSVEAS